MSQDQAPQTEMPRYRCHKEVHALKIARVENPAPPGQELTSGRILHFADPAYAPIKVGPEYVLKHLPHAGGYYIVYPGGYCSFSPAEAFESGYTLLT